MNEIESLKNELKDTKLMLYSVMQMYQFKGGFLARSAHELKSPLSSLIGLHQIILEDLCEDHEEERQFIAKAKDYSLKLLDLLDQVINISKIECGKISIENNTISLNLLLKNIYNLVYIYAKDKGLRLKFIFLEYDIFIKTDKNIIQQILVLIIHSIISILQEGEMKVFPSISKETKQVIVHIEFPFDSKIFSDEIHLLNKPIKIDDPALEIKKNNLNFSPEMSLILAQNLLEKIGGFLKLKNPPLKTNLQETNNIKNSPIQLMCYFPLAVCTEKIQK